MLNGRLVRLMELDEHVLVGGGGAMTRHRRGMGPPMQGMIFVPPPSLPRLLISGVTKDSSGAALGNCTVHLFRTNDDVELQQTTSDGSGNYAFDPVINWNGPFYVVAYKAGSPDVAGTTVNTLYGAA